MNSAPSASAAAAAAAAVPSAEVPLAPSTKRAGRPRETVNAACVSGYVKDTHGMRCSAEVKGYGMSQRSCCPRKGQRMRGLLDRAVAEARRDGRKTVAMRDLDRALSFEAHGMSPSTPAPQAKPAPDHPVHAQRQAVPPQPAVAYDSRGQQYLYYPETGQPSIYY